MTVADTGPGIPLEFRDKLFYTAGLTTTNCHYRSGAGLGLCISKCVIDDLGGTIGECVEVCSEFHPLERTSVVATTESALMLWLSQVLTTTRLMAPS